GKEVSAIVREGTQGQLKLLDQALRQFAFGGRDVRFLDKVKVVPKGLTGELLGRGGQQACQGGLAIPVGELAFARRLDGAVDGGEEQIAAHGESLVAFGEVAVEEIDKADLLRQVVEGNDVTESSDIDGLGLRCLLGFVLGGSGDQVAGGAEIDSPDDLRLAVDALAVSGRGIGAAVNELGGQAGQGRHSLGGQLAQLHRIGHTKVCQSGQEIGSRDSN